MPILAPLVAIVALQGGWKPYTLRPGIRVDLPSPPVEQPRDAEGPTVGIWVSAHQELNPIVISHATFEEDGTRLDQVLQFMLLGIHEEAGGKTLAQKDILLNGWPGVELRHQATDGTYRISRNYAMKEQCASITISGLSSKKLDAPATKLFASFRLPAKAGKGPLTVAGPEFKTYPVGDTGISIDLPNPPTLKTHDVGGAHKRKMHQYLCSYVNRIFSVGYTDFEEDEIASMSPEELAEVLREIHQKLGRGFNVKNVRPVASKFAGRDAFHSTYAVPKLFGQARVESVMIGRRTFFALSLTPPVLAKSPEVDKFFASIKVE